MTLLVLPDVEKAAVNYLAHQADVVAITSKVSTEWLGAAPQVQVHRLGGLPVTTSRPLFAATAAMQFDAWGTTKAQARLLADTLCGALSAWPDLQANPALYVSAVAFTQLPQWLPDEMYDPPAPRYVVDADVTYRGS
jgi:hypothetical protein